MCTHILVCLMHPRLSQIIHSFDQTSSRFLFYITHVEVHNDRTFNAVFTKTFFEIDFHCTELQQFSCLLFNIQHDCMILAFVCQQFNWSFCWKKGVDLDLLCHHALLAKHVLLDHCSIYFFFFFPNPKYRKVVRRVCLVMSWWYSNYENLSHLTYLIWLHVYTW